MQKSSLSKKGVYETVRAHGGVCVADEVQTGFGRCGSHYWGFETHGVKEFRELIKKSLD